MLLLLPPRATQTALCIVAFVRMFFISFKVKIMTGKSSDKFNSWRERLLKILPVQMKHFTENELDQWYKSYFPQKVKGLRDVLKIAGIKENELKINCLKENQVEIENLDLGCDSLIPFIYSRYYLLSVTSQVVSLNRSLPCGL